MHDNRPGWIANPSEWPERSYVEVSGSSRLILIGSDLELSLSSKLVVQVSSAVVTPGVVVIAAWLRIIITKRKIMVQL